MAVTSCGDGTSEGVVLCSFGGLYAGSRRTTTPSAASCPRAVRRPARRSNPAAPGVGRQRPIRPRLDRLFTPGHVEWPELQLAAPAARTTRSSSEGPPPCSTGPIVGWRGKSSWTRCHPPARMMKMPALNIPGSACRPSTPPVNWPRNSRKREPRARGKDVPRSPPRVRPSGAASFWMRLEDSRTTSAGAARAASIPISAITAVSRTSSTTRWGHGRALRYATCQARSSPSMWRRRWAEVSRWTFMAAHRGVPPLPVHA